MSTVIIKQEQPLLDAEEDFEHRLQRWRQDLVQERLQAYREDLAEWLSEVLHEDFREDTLISALGDGVALCRLAQGISQIEEAWRGDISPNADKPYKAMKITINPRAAKEGQLFARRDNVSQFLSWGRSLGVPSGVLFETNDLVEAKNEKNVLYCLMEVARCQHAVAPPKLVVMERQIEALETGSAIFKPDESDEEVQRAIEAIAVATGHDKSICKQRDSLGRYYFGQKEPVFVRKLRDHVLVKVGDEWVTLKHYLRLLNAENAKTQAELQSAQHVAELKSSIDKLQAGQTEEHRRRLEAEEAAAKSIQEMEAKYLADQTMNQQRLEAVESELAKKAAEVEDEKRQRQELESQYANRMHHIDKEAKERMESLRHDLDQQLANMEQRVAQKTAQLERERNQRRALEQNAQQDLDRLKKMLQDSESSHIATEKQLRDQIKQQIADIEQQQRERKQQDVTTQQKLDALVQELDQAKQNYLAQEARLLDEQAKREDAWNKYMSANTDLSQLRKQIAAANQAFDQERKRKEEELDTLKHEKDQIQKNDKQLLAAAEEKIKQLASKLEQEQRQFQKQQQKSAETLTNIEAERALAEDKLRRDSKQEIAQLQKQVETLKKQLEAARSPPTQRKQPQSEVIVTRQVSQQIRVANGGPCYSCRQPIKDEYMVVAADQNFHVACFRCSECMTVLDVSPFFIKHNRFYCCTCLHRKFGATCDQCTRPIIPSGANEHGYAVKADGKNYHKTCFCCLICHQQFSHNEHREPYPFEGRLYCFEHAQKLAEARVH